jgi:hypothetical protein
LYIAIAGLPFWSGWDPSAKYGVIDLYAIFLVYALAYVAYTRRQLNQQITAIDGLRLPRHPVFQRLHDAGSFVRSAAKRVFPQVSLMTGAIMILATLGLLVGAPFGCEPRTGMGYLHDPKGWLVGPLRGLNAMDQTHNNLIVVLYATGLLLAAASVALAMCSLFSRKLLGSNLLIAVLSGLATIVCLFFLTDLPFGHVLDFCFSSSSGDSPDRLVELVWWTIAIFLWPVPIGLWLWFANSNKMRQRERWPSLRISLGRWYAPQLGAAVIVVAGSLFEKYKLIGVPIFLAGIMLLAATYERLLRPPQE